MRISIVNRVTSSFAYSYSCLLPVSLLPLPAADAGLIKMRFTQSGNTSSSWPLYVAEQKRFFEKNGLQVEVIIIRGATNVVRAVISDTVPIGRINPDYVIGAASKKAPR